VSVKRGFTVIIITTMMMMMMMVNIFNILNFKGLISPGWGAGMPQWFPESVDEILWCDHSDESY